MRSSRLLAVLSVVGLWASATAAASLNPEDAAGHMGETATVSGVVASAEYEVNVQLQPTLLDLGKSSPNALFTAVIYGDHRAKFGTPETTLRGNRICGRERSAITRRSRKSC
jgi:hypothetical protein